MQRAHRLLGEPARGVGLAHAVGLERRFDIDGEDLELPAAAAVLHLDVHDAVCWQLADLPHQLAASRELGRLAVSDRCTGASHVRGSIQSGVER